MFVAVLISDTCFEYMTQPLDFSNQDLLNDRLLAEGDRGIQRKLIPKYILVGNVYFSNQL